MFSRFQNGNSFKCFLIFAIKYHQLKLALHYTKAPLADIQHVTP